MASVNRATLVGNLGRDPELRFTTSGAAVCNFSIATTEKFTDKDGVKQEKTEWHNIVVWGKTAEACNTYLSKGKSAYVEGRIQTREYEAKDGSGKRKVVEIVATTVQFLSPSDGTKGRTQGGGGDTEGAPVDDSDIPF
jgi:single-strand DNA-binding protein